MDFWGIQAADSTLRGLTRARSLCNNPENSAAPGETPSMTEARRKLLVWILLSMIAAVVSYATFRGYLSPDLLLGFANSFSC